MAEESDSSADLAISMQDVVEAMDRIREHVHYTPVLTSSYLNSISGLDLFFKCELFQKTGSFKVSYNLHPPTLVLLARPFTLKQERIW